MMIGATYQLLVGAALARLRELPPTSIHCVVTSPPYWGLRDYGVPGQLGLEATPDDYVSALRAVFREVVRVLRPDGTCWVNLGDAYAQSGRGSPGAEASALGGLTGQRASFEAQRARGAAAGRPPAGLRAKNLLGLPWRVAFALQADGWLLRQDCIWHKVNPQPEAVEDRPSTDHEHVFLLARRGRYFYDGDAVRQPVTGNAHPRGVGVNPKASAAGAGAKQNVSWSAAVRGVVDSRNLRSVWTFATQPSREAHFATFPEELPRRCILAGTSERGCCAACGAQVVRVVEKRRLVDGEPAPLGAHRQSVRGGSPGAMDNNLIEGVGHGRISTERVTLGWRPGCECGAPAVPAAVLDPFAGTSTTGVVALKLGRSFDGVELNARYAAISARRLAGVSPLFARATAGGGQMSVPGRRARWAPRAA